MTEKDYLDPKGYWGDPAGNVRRMSGDSIGAFWRPASSLHAQSCLIDKDFPALG
jgi:hypothetical protein